MIDIKNYTPIQTSSMNLKTKIKSKLWLLVYYTLFKYSPFFFRKWRVFLVRGFGADVDWSCSLNRNCKIDHPWNLKMGVYSSLDKNSWAYCLDKVTIGSKCCIGENVMLITGSHLITSPNFDLVTKPILIDDGVWIATNSIILPSINLGSFSVVGAGSIVTKNVNEFTVVGGNPAKLIKKRVLNEK